MDQEQSFLAALEAAPEDDSTWLVYADWLEERGDPRGQYLRLRAALWQGLIGPERVEPTVERLAELRRSLDPLWHQRCIGLLRRRPLRFQITSSRHGQGSILTSVVGVLALGMLRVCDGVAVPLVGGGLAHTWVQHLSIEGRNLTQFAVDQVAAEFDLTVPRCPADVLWGAFITPWPEGAAELQRRLEMSLAELELSIRATNCLESEAMMTVLDLVTWTAEELLDIRNFGETTLREVQARLQERGLCLGMRLPAQAAGSDS